MGRELKRVPMDFDWELGKKWKGYLNPLYTAKDCSVCDCSGYNKETKKISDEWYSFDEQDWEYLGNGRRYNKLAHSNNITEVEIDALLEAGRLMDFTRVPLNEEQRKEVEEKVKNGGNSWLPYNNGYIPTPDEVNKWNREGVGHDGINMHICVKARAKDMGVYGLCEICDGEGVVWDSEESKKKYEEWESFDPPKGEGFQLWETTSEGSPKSPVFDNLEDLCKWCADNTTVFGKETATKEEWAKMLGEEFVHYKNGNMIFI